MAHVAAQGGYAPILEYLLRNDSRGRRFLDVKDNMGQTPMFIAGIEARLEAFKWCIIHSSGGPESVWDQLEGGLTIAAGAFEEGEAAVPVLELLLQLSPFGASCFYPLISGRAYMPNPLGLEEKHIPLLKFLVDHCPIGAALLESRLFDRMLGDTSNIACRAACYGNIPMMEYLVLNAPV